MLRDVVGNFLNSLTEREFDAPLLALLAQRGFKDVHFLHGSFEFGKDVIAKRVCPETGEVHQYAIQSKAGDIGLPGWREVRPQLEESGYNTRAHPNYDSSLKRVAVLVTTGRLKGAAAIDAQEFKQAIEARGQSQVEFWDYLTLTEWLAESPDSGFFGHPNDKFLELVGGAAAGKLREADLEKYTRRWLYTKGGPSDHLAVACIEAAIISNKFRTSFRLDLAAAISLHLLRAADSAREVEVNRAISLSALRLFTSYADHLLLQAEPLLDDSYELVRAVAGPMSIMTYPVVALRLFEIFGLLALVTPTEDEELAARAREAVIKLTRKHPGAARPVSDDFAVSMLAPVIVLRRNDIALCERYLHAVAQWILDRSDPALGGLGLGASGESEETITERLLGGSLESTKMGSRRQSLVAAAVLDLMYLSGFQDLHEALRDDLNALGIDPIELAVAPERANWKRGGIGIGAPQELQLGKRYSPLNRLEEREVESRYLHDIALMSVSRSWYGLDALAFLIRIRIRQ